MNPHNKQIQAIQSMLAAGHRSVHLERHSLLLIGGVGGFISAMTEYLITAERFPDITQRALVLLLWLSLWLGGMAALDHRLTRRARLRRDETLPFAQAQITRAWWMLLGMGVLGSFAMFFHGGGGMIYALWIVLLGLGIYFFGLFSRPLIEWIGLATILLGVTGLAAGLPFGVMHWLAASCFAIGMPMAGWLNAKFCSDSLRRGLLALVLWLLAVVTPPLLLTRITPTNAPAAIPSEFVTTPLTGEQVLRLAAGSSVPLRVDLDSPILDISPLAGLDMTLKQPVEIALLDGKPDGRYRIGDGVWHAIHDGVLNLRIDRISPLLDAHEAPEVRAHARFEGAEFKGDRP